jgi:hypothetical protein
VRSNPFKTLDEQDIKQFVELHGYEDTLDKADWDWLFSQLKDGNLTLGTPWNIWSIYGCSRATRIKLMPTTETPRGRRRSLAEVVEAIESADNPVQAVLEQTIERLRKRDPELADCVRLGAIPRELDAELLGALRGKPEDRADNERLLQGLLALSFVAPTSRRGCRYQDATRQWILGEWRSEPTRKEEFDKLNEMLVRFHEERHRQARELEQDLERVKELLLRTTRRASCNSSRSSNSGCSLLEGIYHASLVSVEAAYSFSRATSMPSKTWAAAPSWSLSSTRPTKLCGSCPRARNKPAGSSGCAITRRAWRGIWASRSARRSCSRPCARRPAKT